MADFAATRAKFHLPQGVIYLDGNSLGPMPLAAEERVRATVREEWGNLLITGWNKAGWMAQPGRIGDRIARLIGAEPGTVVLGDTLSIKIYQALASALELNPSRKVVLSDSGNFPSDLYMAEGLLRSLGNGYALRVVAPGEVAGAIDACTAVVMLTEVDYRTGRKHDMAALTALAHDRGALALWDLAHSAGALPVDLAGCDVDFAAGCTYKYLNSGPGGPAFIYLAPRHAQTARPALSGWLGHESPFGFDLTYRPAAGVERMRIGTPPVLQMAALETALDIWDMVTIAEVRARSIELTEAFIAGVEAACPMLDLASPRHPDLRGSQISFRHEEGSSIMQALTARGVIGDFRAPDILRFGFAPLYNSMQDVEGAVAILSDIMQKSLWKNPEYRVRHRVT